MPTNAENVTLLEYLAQRLGCAYLSDLHFAVQAGALLRQFVMLAPSRFPISQWKEAYQYLIGLPPPDATAESLRQALLHYYAEDGGRKAKKGRKPH